MLAVFRPHHLISCRSIWATLRGLRVRHAQEPDRQHLKSSGHPKIPVAGAEGVGDAFWFGVRGDGPAEAVVTGVGGDQANPMAVTGPLPHSGIVAGGNGEGAAPGTGGSMLPPPPPQVR